jgi:hypothetical protein
MGADLERFYSTREEPVRSYLQDVRELILAHDPLITEDVKYGMPFFLYRKKMFCYFWTRKESGQPYLGLVEGNRLFHPELIQEGRARMKIFLLDPTKKVPVQTISMLLAQAIELYTSGQVRIK